MSRYQGFANYETWVTCLWIDNDEGMYHYVMEEAKNYKNDLPGLAGWLQSDLMEMIPDSDNGWVNDLLNNAFGSIDWYEVAENVSAKIV